MACKKKNFTQSRFITITIALALSLIGCNSFKSDISCNQPIDVSDRYDWDNLKQFSHKAHISFNDARSMDEAGQFTKSLGYTTLGFWVNGIVVELPCGTDAVNEVFTRYWGASDYRQTIADSSFVAYAHPIFLDSDDAQITPTNVIITAFKIELDKAVIDSIVAANHLTYSNFNPGSDLNRYNLILKESATRDPIEMGQYLNSLDETRAA